MIFGASRSASDVHLVEQGVLADRVGSDFFGIGEHHTNDFPTPAGDVVLAAIAARTSRIHLGSAVIVLSSDDPVRVFQCYSTLNAISGGRAEVILGRGSSIAKRLAVVTSRPATALRFVLAGSRVGRWP